MSAKASFWAWSQREIGSTAKLVLLCLADCHNADTGRCDPSAQYISDKSELNIKSVYAAIQKLRNMGLVSAENRAGRSPDYHLNITQIWDNPKTGTPKNGYTQKRVHTLPKNGYTPYPNLGDESKKNLKGTYNKKNNKKKFDAAEMEIPSTVNGVSWLEWVAFRKQKKPITEIAARKQIDLLTQYTHEVQADIINRSIQNDYQGLFPLNGGAHAASQPSGIPASRRPTLPERVRANNERRARERASRNSHGEAMGEAASDVRPQVYEPVRGGGGQHMGDVFDGDYTTSDS